MICISNSSLKTNVLGSFLCKRFALFSYRMLYLNSCSRYSYTFVFVADLSSFFHQCSVKATLSSQNSTSKFEEFRCPKKLKVFLTDHTLPHHNVVGFWLGCFHALRKFLKLFFVASEQIVKGMISSKRVFLNIF